MSETIVSSAKPIHGIFGRVYRDILTNKVKLPSMPHVALRIRAAMQMKNFSSETVARVIEADPGTSAYLIRIANGPIYRGAVPINDVQTAVSRFGMQSTRNLVTAYALRAMFTTRSPVLARIMQSNWHRSARIAALSAVIAKRCPGFVPDQAMLAGLLQDIGILPLLGALENSRHLTSDAQRIEQTMESFSGKIGPVLLKHWGFDEDTIEVARSRKNWTRNPAPQADLADLVLIARLYAGIGTAEQSEQPCIHDVPAFSKLPLGRMGRDESIAILKLAEHDVQDVMRMLGV